ncbi:MAG: hypothetical protein ACREC5_04535 [Thermoplasmata archaeon]
MTAPREAPAPRWEIDLAAPVAERLRGDGYEVFVDPDGTGYFDIAARRGEEIGLVELKLSAWRTLLRQAVARRAYGDWVAAALPRDRLTERIAKSSEAGPGRSIGVWLVAGGRVEVIRPARPWPAETRASFRPCREALRELLDQRSAGLLPEGTSWTGFPARSGRARGSRASTEWRIEEFGAAGPGR